MGHIKSINISTAKGGPKSPVPQAMLVARTGIEGDAHSGPGKKQVSLLAWERTLAMRAKGAAVGYGSFGENITTVGIDLRSLRMGDRLKLGVRGIVEVTELGKKCPAPCAIFRQVGSCIMPEEGVFCRVTEGGAIRVGDPVVLKGSGLRITINLNPINRVRESRNTIRAPRGRKRERDQGGHRGGER